MKKNQAAAFPLGSHPWLFSLTFQVFCSRSFNILSKTAMELKVFVILRLLLALSETQIQGYFIKMVYRETPICFSFHVLYHVYQYSVSFHSCFSFSPQNGKTINFQIT